MSPSPTHYPYFPAADTRTNPVPDVPIAPFLLGRAYTQASRTEAGGRTARGRHIRPRGGARPLATRVKRLLRLCLHERFGPSGGCTVVASSPRRSAVRPDRRRHKQFITQTSTRFRSYGRANIQIIFFKPWFSSRSGTCQWSSQWTVVETSDLLKTRS